MAVRRGLHAKAEDPESSTGAFYFARSWNYILTISSMVAVGQASISPIFSDALLIGICQTIIEAGDWAGRD